MAERVGFEPTVPLLGRMLSKHVDSTTLAPLRADFGGGILTRGPMTGKAKEQPPRKEALTYVDQGRPPSYTERNS